MTVHTKPRTSPETPGHEDDSALAESERAALACTWFGVSGFGFGVWGLGFRVWGLGFRVWGLGIEGAGFRI